MKRLAARIMVLCTALLLALPPGWCCAALARAPKKAAEPPPVCCCCHQTEAPPKAPAAPPPAFPLGRSCCQQDAVAPATFKAPIALDVAAILPLCIAHLPLVSVSLSSLADENMSILFPPLQVLHCVWHC
jgi:hypothetical protein